MMSKPFAIRTVNLFLMALAMLFSPTGLYAQIDRSGPPEPLEEREVKAVDYRSFVLDNGLQVFVVEDHRLPRVRFSIQLLCLPTVEGDKAGCRSLAGDMLGTGTKTRSKARLDEEIDYIGGSLKASSWSIDASSLTRHKDKLLDLMTDVLYRSVFLKKEFKKLKKQRLAAMAAERDDPEALADRLKDMLVYGKDHPAGEQATEATIKAITLDDVESYYKSFFIPQNACLAIVGDITLQEARRIADTRFAQWQAASPAAVPCLQPKAYDAQKDTLYPKPQLPGGVKVALIDRPNAVQSVIRVAYPIELRPGPPNRIKARVMASILGSGSSSRLYKNLRETHGYTYGAYAYALSGALSGEFAVETSTRNATTFHTIVEALDELRGMRADAATDRELKEAKATFAGLFVRSLEDPATIARFAVNTAKYGLPNAYYRTFLQRLAAVSKDDVKAMAERYIHPDSAYVVVVGKADDIADTLASLGPLTYYDTEGAAYTPKKAPPLPAGLTAGQVIDDYLKAIGGRKRLEAVQTMRVRYHANVSGEPMEMTLVRQAPRKFILKLTRKKGEAPMQRIVSDGNDVAVFSMGKKIPVDAQTQIDMKERAVLFPELYMEPRGLQLRAAKRINDRKAYAVDYTSPSGTLSTFYYDMETGLKIGSLQTTKDAQGNPLSVYTIWEDYREVDEGIKVPFTMRTEQGQVRSSFEAVDVQINPADIVDAMFTVN